jgi:hypothetical protein
MGTAADGDAGVPFREPDVVSRDCERSPDRNVLLRAFVVVTARLGGAGVQLISLLFVSFFDFRPIKISPNISDGEVHCRNCAIKIPIA